eukprot:4186487-Alexandrium_andersonii.AAC.1
MRGHRLFAIFIVPRQSNLVVGCLRKGWNTHNNTYRMIAQCMAVALHDVCTEGKHERKARSAPHHRQP